MMYKILCATALCCGVVCCDVASGMKLLPDDSVKELASAMTNISEITKNLKVVAESSKPESGIQQDYKRIGELYKRLNGTPEFAKWCDEHPIYAGWLKLLNYLGN